MILLTGQKHRFQFGNISPGNKRIMHHLFYKVDIAHTFSPFHLPWRMLRQGLHTGHRNRNGYSHHFNWHWLCRLACNQNSCNGQEYHCINMKHYSFTIF